MQIQNFQLFNKYYVFMASNFSSFSIFIYVKCIHSEKAARSHDSTDEGAFFLT